MKNTLTTLEIKLKNKTTEVELLSTSVDVHIRLCKEKKMTSSSSNLCAFLLLLLMVAESNTNNTQSVVKAKRPSIVSFQSLDKHVLLGLDLVVPFLTMPVGKHKDKNGNERVSKNEN